MDLRAQLLKEAERLEAQANQIREAAKVLGAAPTLTGTAVVRPKRDRRKSRKVHRVGHYATCAVASCGRRFLSYVRKYKGASNAPLCSAACRSRERRQRIASKPTTQATLPLGRPKGVVLVAGDGVSKGA